MREELNKSFQDVKDRKKVRSNVFYVRVTPDLKSKIQKLADEQGLSLNETINAILEAAVN
jgi:predicted HicB family RNase H-like nuclease